MPENGGRAIGVLAQAHDGAKWLMIRQASPRSEGQNVVDIGPARRAVYRLRRQHDFRQGLEWRNVFGPVDRGILYGRALQIDAELGAEFIYRRVLVGIFDDRMTQFIVVM